MGISVYDTKNYAQYNPLSIQEIWAPGQALRQQHDQLAEEYAQQELLGGAASLGLQEGVDKQALADNKAYMDALKQSADELSTKGFIDAGRRKNLYKLKQQYTTTVLPIQNALKERNAAIQFDREMRAKDQTYESKFDPSKVAVTDYLKNNQAFNAKGISKGKMFEDAARDFSTLKNSVSQKYPDLVKTGVLGRLWTIVNSDIGVEEVAGFVANEAKSKNIDPAKLSAIGQQMHNIVENNLRKHGAYDFAGDDVNKISELRTGLANAATYAINDPKFGTMDDPMALFNAQQKQAQQQQLNGKSHQEFDGSYNENALNSLDSMLSMANATTGGVGTKVLSEEQFYRSREASRGAVKGTYDDYKKSVGAGTSGSDQKNIFKLAYNLERQGKIKVPKNIHPKDLPAWNKKVVEMTKEDYKDSNKTHFYYNTKSEAQQKFNNYLSGLEDVVDVNGDDISKDKIFGKNGSLLQPAIFKFGKNGAALQLTTDDAKSVTVPFQIEKLGNGKLNEIYGDLTKLRASGAKPSDFEIYYQAINNILAGEMYSQISTAEVQPGIY